MKVVKRKHDGAFVYRQSPDFEKGKGIANAVAIGLGLEFDLRELEVTEEEWEGNWCIQKDAEEAAITAEIQRMNRDQAMINLGLQEAPSA